jgi:hypothetical protein
MLFDSLLMSQTKLAYGLKEKTLKLILSVICYRKMFYSVNFARLYYKTFYVGIQYFVIKIK